MVEVKAKLYVTPEEFFTVLENSLAEEIKQDTGKKVRPKDFKKGYTYYKKMRNKVGTSGKVKIHFDEYERNVKYQASFYGAQGKTIMGYYIEPLDDESIGITYRETFEGNSFLKNLNQKMMEFLFYRRKAKKRVLKMLDQMEKYIHEDRNIEADIKAELGEQND